VRDTAPIPDALFELQLGELDPRLLYHPGHTWVRIEDPARVRIGLDTFAARIAGRPRSVIVPQPGTRVRRGHPCAWLDLAGGTLTILSPLSGVLLEPSPRALATPEAGAEDPRRTDWLLVLEPEDLQRDLRHLEPAARFARRVERDARAWKRQIRCELRAYAPHLGATLQDGGSLVEDLDQLLGPRRRCEIARSFLGCGRCLR
jgi:glycine cleavage system H lipoate-binding protein